MPGFGGRSEGVRKYYEINLQDFPGKQAWIQMLYPEAGAVLWGRGRQHDGIMEEEHSMEEGHSMEEEHSMEEGYKETGECHSDSRGWRRSPGVAEEGQDGGGKKTDRR